MDEASESNPLTHITYDGKLWVHAWNLTPAQARVGGLIKGIRYKDGTEEEVNQ